jgi:hypothetical protein
MKDSGKLLADVIDLLVIKLRVYDIVDGLIARPRHPPRFNATFDARILIAKYAFAHQNQGEYEPEMHAGRLGFVSETLEEA